MNINILGIEKGRERESIRGGKMPGAIKIEHQTEAGPWYTQEVQILAQGWRTVDVLGNSLRLHVDEQTKSVLLQREGTRINKNTKADVWLLGSLNSLSRVWKALKIIEGSNQNEDQLGLSDSDGISLELTTYEKGVLLLATVSYFENTPEVGDVRPE